MQAQFIGSSPEWQSCPPPTLPEYAFIGRSNVGKSSLINMLTNHGSLAKVSATPGKTQLINHFLIENKWYLVDLPGYGYAKVGKGLRHAFEAMITNYLLRRPNLMSTFVLVDCRLEPQKSDLDRMAWLGRFRQPFAIVFTKADKLSKGKLHDSLSRYEATLLETWAQVPPIFVTSAESKFGREALLAYIETIHPLFDPNKFQKA